jgi:hypothetical protein
MAAINFHKGPKDSATSNVANNIKLTGTKGQDIVVPGAVTQSDETSVDDVTESQNPDMTVAEDMAGGEYSDARIQEYYEYLKTKGITDTDLIQVLDTIITSGSVKWAFKLFNKIDVEMIMRPAWVNSFILREVETLEPRTFSRFTDIVSMYNLAGSLIKYNDQRFIHDSEEDIRKNYFIISKFSFIIQNKLIQQLAIFDRLVAVATSDWAIENFTEPQSEN